MSAASAIRFQPQSLVWFACHELLLAWRDWLSMMTAGKSARERTMLVVSLIFVAGIHALAYSVLAPVFKQGAAPDKLMFAVIGATLLLAFFMMLSQALESVTRAFYTRSDLELILSSPVSPRNVFAVRIGALTLTTAAMTLMLVAPFVHVAVYLDGAGWLAAYPVMLAGAMLATAVAVWIMMALFHLIGPARTRLVAQIVAAVIGASFLIGIQVVAIFSYNSISRLSLLQDHAVISALPTLESAWWLPVNAAMGNVTALAVVTITAVAVLGLTVWQTSKGFAGLVLVTGSLGAAQAKNASRVRSFRSVSPRWALIFKEWRLLQRDPWLVSQTLMQVLYLLPPALLLWKNFGDTAGISVILAPVLVMALGQLAGGLAWLTISGEDAAELIGTAPVAPQQMLLAKIAAVLAVVGIIAVPLALAMAVFAPMQAVIMTLGVIAAAASAIAIQLWFRGPAKRTHFRYRQTASKVATLSEAFSSLMWAGAAALFAAGMVVGVVFVGLALVVLLIAWLLS